MNIEHLSYFCKVVELGSINKAALALYISQPRLSKIITGIEDEVGSVLLVRTKNGVSPTEEGLELVKYAKGILDEYQKIISISKQNSDNRRASLKVSMVRFTYIMESFIAVEKKHQHDRRFIHSLTEGSAEDVIDDVAARIAQIGVIHLDSRHQEKIRNSLRSKGLRYYPIAAWPPHILLSKDHPLIKGGENISLENLAKYPFIRFTGQYEDFTNVLCFGTEEVNLNASQRIVYVSSRLSQLHTIGNSNCYGIGTSDFSMQEAFYRVLSLPIDGCTSQFEFGYILPEGETATPIIEEFIDDITRRCQTL